MKKTKAEAQKTRTYLLKAALNTFYVKGVSRASLNEIAQNAGVTRGALYWHFRNKEDMFEALFQSLFEDVSTQLEHDIENRSPNIWESLELSVIDIFCRLETDESLRKFFNILHTKCEYTEQNHAIIKIMRIHHDMWQRQLTSVMTISQEQGRLPEDLDVRLSVIHLMSVISGLMQTWLNMPEQFRVSDTARHIIPAALYSLIHSPHMRKKNIDAIA